MNELGQRLQRARIALNLSQEYIAQQLGVSRSAISQIELGKRKVTGDELTIFSNIYGISTDELLKGRPVEMPSQVFTRRFQQLDEIDQNEILNLMEFKCMMKERKSK